MIEKFVGCLVGCAVGDSLGSIFEGLPAIEFEEPKSLTWTDDTHMMIGVAESLIANKGFDGDHMAQTFIKNYELEPWRGYAPGPPMVFKLIKSGMAWNEASKTLFGGEGSYGNGGAMRVAPLGLFYHDDTQKLRDSARAVSEITHAHELGKEGAALQAYAVALAFVESLSSRSFLRKLRDFTKNEVYLMKLERAEKLLEGESKREVVRDLGNGIEAHKSVPTAIYSFLRSESFEEAVEYAVSLGGDMDTIGAMTGAISGAHYGVREIPGRWRGKLERGKYIEELAEKLFYVKRELG